MVQIVRTGLQRKLSDDIDIYTTTWVRYVFSCPLAIAVFVGLATAAGGLGEMNLSALFFVYCVGGSITQIVATVLLLATFQQRNFAIGTTYAQTEGVQIAVIGAAFLDITPSPLGWVGVGIAALAVVLMAQSVGGGRLHGVRTTAMGLGAGLFFALTILHVRLAYEALGYDHALAASSLTLSVMVMMQTVLLWAVLRWRRVAFWRVWQQRQARRLAVAIGLTSFAGSFLWFTCFYIANPAYVKILAQVELPLAYLVSRRAFAENPNRYEMCGMAAAAAAAILVTLA